MPKTKSTLKNQKITDPVVQVVKPEPLKTLLKWESSERFFKKRSHEFFTTTGSIIFLLIVVMAFIQEWLLIIVVIALAFLAYVLATIEPQKTEHEITNRGIKTGGRRYEWGELGNFWFEGKWNQKAVYIENFASLPKRLMMLLEKVDEKKIEEVLAQYLPKEKPEKTWLDNAGSWLSRNVPLEKDQK